MLTELEATDATGSVFDAFRSCPKTWPIESTAIPAQRIVQARPRKKARSRYLVMEFIPLDNFYAGLGTSCANLLQNH
jgi:hypothetical protein